MSSHRLFGRGRVVCAVLAALFFCVSVADADAARRRVKARGAPAAERSQGMDQSGRYAAYVVDAKTGRVLFARNGENPRYPASLTKMMTLYILFEELERGRIKLDTPLEVSAVAAMQAPSKLGLRPGQTIEVEDAIKALVTKSANDASVVIAENLSGSHEAFAQRMTRTARRIGMSDTTFRNANGLPNPGQITTAKDMVTLGMALQDRFPSYYRYFATRSMAWRGGAIGNHNRLLGRVEGVDGIKTGYTRASGFNLVSSVRRDGRHVVAAVMGGPTGRARDNHMAQLLETYLPAASRGAKSFAIADQGGREDAPPVPRAAPDRPTAASSVVVRDEPVVERGAAVAMAKAILLPDSGGRPGEPISILPPSQAPRHAVASAGAVAMPAPAPSARAGAFVPPAPIGASASRVTGYAEPQSRSVAALAVRDADPVVTRSTGEPTALRSPERVVAHPEPAPRRPETVRGDPARHETKAEAAAEAHKGWMIQIAAVDSEPAAKALLSKARGDAGSVLAGRVPVTEPVSKGSSTLYRARFAGFVDQATANAACASLKRKDYSCLALRQ